MAKYVKYQSYFEGEWQPYWEWERENAYYLPEDAQGWDDEEANQRRKRKRKMEDHKNKKKEKKRILKFNDFY